MAKESVKIAAISDMHGHLPPAGSVPDCDLLVIAGDLGPATHAYHRAGHNWIGQVFDLWLREVRECKRCEIVGIAGNHDFVAEQSPRFMRTLPWDYLHNESAAVAGVNVWGSPDTPPFFDWAFNTPEEELAEIYASIPGDTDVIVTHGPPHGVLDRSVRGVHCGGRSLLDAVHRIRPACHIFGHIHESAGVHRCHGLLSVNASSVDEHYQPRPHRFQVFDLTTPTERKEAT